VPELRQAIGQRVAQHLRSEIPLPDLEDWFLPALWDVDGGDESTRQMAGIVHILISEFSRGDRTLEGLREGLA